MVEILAGAAVILCGWWLLRLVDDRLEARADRKWRASLASERERRGQK